MDEGVADGVAAQEARGLRDNSLILFHSDDGGVTNSLFAGGTSVVGAHLERAAARRQVPAPRGRHEVGRAGELARADAAGRGRRADRLGRHAAHAGGAGRWHGAGCPAARRDGCLAGDRRGVRPHPGPRSSATSIRTPGRSVRANGSWTGKQPCRRGWNCSIWPTTRPSSATLSVVFRPSRRGCSRG